MTYHSEYYWDVHHHLRESMDKQTPTREIEYPAEPAPSSSLPPPPGFRTLEQWVRMSDEANDAWRKGRCCGHEGECYGSWCFLASGPCYRRATEEEIRKHWKVLAEFAEDLVNPYEFADAVERWIAELEDMGNGRGC